MPEDGFSGLIAGGIKVVEDGDKRQVLVGGRPYFSWNSSDEAGQRAAVVQLYELGLGTQEEIAKAFGLHLNSVYNYINAWRADGIQGLVSKQRGPKGSWKINRDIKGKILLTILKLGLDGSEDIQDSLKKIWDIEVSVETIRQVLIESGLIDSRGRIPDIKGPGLFDDTFPDNDQLEFKFEFKDRAEEIFLENLEKKEEIKEYYPEAEKKWLSSYSKAERAYLNELERGSYNVYGGGLLFVPLLRRYKFLETIKEVVDVRLEDGYNLDQLCLSLFYFDLFQFRSLENFKSSYPEEFGILLGRLSSPGVRTLWRFMEDAANLEKGEQLSEKFAKLYLSSGLTKWGVLYIDEHLIPYYGKETVSMGYHTVRQMPLKGSYSYVALDEAFNPLLYLLRSSSERITAKIPEIIIKVKQIAKECGENPENLVIVFDRGGYSAKLFRELAKLNVYYITWAKYFDKWVNDIEESKFDKTAKINYAIQDSDEIKYFELERKVRKYGNMRTIAIQSGRKKQRAAIYTNDDSDAERIIQLICRRWGQENWNKAMKLEHRIDYSPGYEFEDLYEQPMVENPLVKELRQERSKLSRKLYSLKADFADSLLKQKSELDWEKIKKKKLEIRADMEAIQSKIFLLNQEIDKLPKEVPFDQAHGERLVKFNYERKRFLDSIKVFVYAMEKKMCECTMNYHGKAKEAWPIMGMIFKRGAIVKLEKDRLSVKLRRFKNPAVDYVARHLCEDLNSMRSVTLDKYCFPIRYKVL